MEGMRFGTLLENVVRGNEPIRSKLGLLLARADV